MNAKVGVGKDHEIKEKSNKSCSCIWWCAYDTILMLHFLFMPQQVCICFLSLLLPKLPARFIWNQFPLQHIGEEVESIQPTGSQNLRTDSELLKNSARYFQKTFLPFLFTSRTPAELKKIRQNTRCDEKSYLLNIAYFKIYKVLFM